MTAQHDPGRKRFAARTVAHRAMLDLARGDGIPVASYPPYPGAPAATPEVAALTGLNLSRRIELAAREHSRSYIRAAREAGHTWHDIGTALGLVPGGDAQQEGETVAEAAFTYAAGHPGTDHARRYGRYVGWTCGTCDSAITDYGLSNGPADDEQGHTRDCGRHATAIAAWHADWDEIEAGWEAGR